MMDPMQVSAGSVTVCLTKEQMLKIAKEETEKSLQGEIYIDPSFSIETIVERKIEKIIVQYTRGLKDHVYHELGIEKPDRDTYGSK